MEREKSIENIRNIRKLIINAEKISDHDFRLILERLIKNGDENSEYVLIKYMTSIEVGIRARMNIIRTAGYLHYQSFLEPLKRIIESESNINLKKESIISIAKYNDRRALNILNMALKNIKNTLLLQTINNEISQIKQNKPILTLMPRFIKEKDNPKNFRLTIDVLKQILSPSDALNFVKFLSQADLKVQDGAFEVLCATGPESIKKDLYGFIFKRQNEISCVEKGECDEFNLIISHFYIFISRFPALVDEMLADLESLFILVKDVRIKMIVLNMISLSRSDLASEILVRIFNSNELFRHDIIIHLGKNPRNFSFLYDLYQSDHMETEKTIQALMMIEQGIAFFHENYDQKEFDEKEIILRHFPLSENELSQQFCKKIFASDAYNLKVQLLERIQNDCEFQMKPVLFSPEMAEFFMPLEKEYFSTILKLYPITAFKKIIELIIFEEYSVVKSKRFMNMLLPSMGNELVFDFDDSSLLNYLSNRVVNQNNPDLNLLYLQLIGLIKVIKPKSFNDLEVAVNLYINQRGNKLVTKEKYEIRKIRENFKNMSLLKRRIDISGRNIAAYMQNESIAIEKIELLIKDNSDTLVLLYSAFIDLLIQNMKQVSGTDLDKWLGLLETYPQLLIPLEQTLKERAEGSELDRSQGSRIEQILGNCPQKSRIILRIDDRHLVSKLVDQFKDFLPDLAVLDGDDDILPSDILFCDAKSFYQIRGDGEMPSKHVFLFLNKTSDFAEFKAFNPKFYIKPYSFHRILKEILKELLLIK